MWTVGGTLHSWYYKACFLQPLLGHSVPKSNSYAALCGVCSIRLCLTHKLLSISSVQGWMSYLQPFVLFRVWGSSFTNGIQKPSSLVFSSIIIMLPAWSIFLVCNQCVENMSKILKILCSNPCNGFPSCRGKTQVQTELAETDSLAHARLGYLQLPFPFSLIQTS